MAKYAAEKLADLPATYRKLLPETDKPEELAAGEKTIREQFAADMKDANITVPAAAAKPGRTYRARVRHKDTSGRWSHWSAPVGFVASGPDLSALQQDLVISEIMYNPASGQEHEYIELFNIGDSTLDLTDLRFTKGIDFDFPAGTTAGTTTSSGHTQTVM